MNNKLNMFFIMACVSSYFVACVDGGGVLDSYSTSNIMCLESASGSQLLEYNTLDTSNNPPTTGPLETRTLNYSYAWSCDDDQRVLSGNGVPNHPVTNGVFASDIEAQDVSLEFPLQPSSTNIATYIKEPGYAVNSIKLDPATAGRCTDNAQDANDSNDCDPAGQNGGDWTMVALKDATILDSDWDFDFGTDTSNGHVQPGGAYHYHGIPSELVQQINASSMTLVAWAVDGFPIYAQYGFIDADDAGSGLKDIKSSYQIKKALIAIDPVLTFLLWGILMKIGNM